MEAGTRPRRSSLHRSSPGWGDARLRSNLNRLHPFLDIARASAYPCFGMQPLQHSQADIILAAFFGTLGAWNG
jgi:hypothetical protein